MSRCGAKFKIKTARVVWVNRVCVLEDGHSGNHLSRRSADKVPQNNSMSLTGAVHAVKALHLFPDDVVVVEMSRRITVEQAKLIQQHLEAEVGQRPIVILSPEMKLSAVGPLHVSDP